MKFLIYHCEDSLFTQVDAESLSRELLDKISNDDVVVLRPNPDTGEFEEYDTGHQAFKPVDAYQDDEDDEEESRQRVIAGLRGDPVSPAPSIKWNLKR